MREKEDRVRFSGYSVANFKVFVFCMAAIFAAIGGAMFTLNVGFMSPSFVGIVPSIEMVIYTAVGGRLSILGAIYGTLLVNFAKTCLSETFPEFWLFGLGGLFIAVVRPSRTAWPVSGVTMCSRASALSRVEEARTPGTAGPTAPSPTALRRSEEIVCSLVTSPRNSCSRSRPHRVVRRVQGGQRSSFYVDENEIRVIIGPNGAGKTTCSI